MELNSTAEAIVEKNATAMGGGGNIIAGGGGRTEYSRGGAEQNNRCWS